jgi:hypothetical protein
MPYFMRSLTQRSLLIFLTAWLLLSSIGVAWSQATCLFTGIQKLSWATEKPLNNSRKSEIKRTPCFHYKLFQLKNQSAFASKKQVINHIAPGKVYVFSAAPEPLFARQEEYNLNDSSFIVKSQAVRRAHLQVYRI